MSVLQQRLLFATVVIVCLAALTLIGRPPRADYTAKGCTLSRCTNGQFPSY